MRSEEALHAGKKHKNSLDQKKKREENIPLVLSNDDMNMSSLWSSYFRLRPISEVKKELGVNGSDVVYK